MNRATHRSVKQSLWYAWDRHGFLTSSSNVPVQQNIATFRGHLTHLLQDVFVQRRLLFFPEIFKRLLKRLHCSSQLKSLDDRHERSRLIENDFCLEKGHWKSGFDVTDIRLRKMKWCLQTDLRKWIFKPNDHHQASPKWHQSIDNQKMKFNCSVHSLMLR